jgi:type IV pilus assembly protein PilC
LPILNSLELLIKRQKDAQLRQILENVRERVKGGELLSDAFAAQGSRPQDLHHHANGGREERQHRRSADPLHQLPAAGDDVPQEAVRVADLSHAAGHRGDDHGDVPVHLCRAQVRRLFNSLDAKLPAITVFMLAVGQNAQKYARLCSSGLVIVGFGLWRWKETDRGADRIDRVILSMPLLGDIRLKHQVANFSRMLSTLLQGGLPLVPAMETAGASMSSRRIVKGVARAGIRVREGARTGQESGRAEDFPRSWQWK